MASMNIIWAVYVFIICFGMVHSSSEYSLSGLFLQVKKHRKDNPTDDDKLPFISKSCDKIFSKTRKMLYDGVLLLESYPSHLKFIGRDSKKLEGTDALIERSERIISAWFELRQDSFLCATQMKESAADHPDVSQGMLLLLSELFFNLQDDMGGFINAVNSMTVNPNSKETIQTLHDFYFRYFSTLQRYLVPPLLIE